MKLTKQILTAILFTGLFAGIQGVRAEEHEHKDGDKPKHHEADAKTEHKNAKAKAYPLDKCLVSDEKLGEHGKPYVFTHEGQEIKLCRANASKILVGGVRQFVSCTLYTSVYIDADATTS